MAKTKILSLSLPVKVENRLDKFAEKRGKSRSSVVADALRYYFLAQEFSLLQQEISMRAKILNIADEKDVDKLVHSLRNR